MDKPINRQPAKVIHIDINSCFATLEQQANHLLRGKPVAVAAYTTDSGCIVSPSIEAKQAGIKTGMRVAQARQICPQLIVLQPDVDKYRYIHQQFIQLLGQFAPSVTPLSIDEAVLDFRAYRLPGKMDITQLAGQIKQQIRQQIGDWISCNAGIAPSRFLAKLAAGYNKPDGLTLIDHTNLIQFYAQLSLTDLPGINRATANKLNQAGIYRPTEFLQASAYHLQHRVFRSVIGYYWYLKLRGWDPDQHRRQGLSLSQRYSLPQATADKARLKNHILALTQKLGQRLRSRQLSAKCVELMLYLGQGQSWRRQHQLPWPVCTNQQLYHALSKLIDHWPGQRPARIVSVAAKQLIDWQPSQLELWTDQQLTRLTQLNLAVDQVNQRYGNFTVCPAQMLASNHRPQDRIAFGNTGNLPAK